MLFPSLFFLHTSTTHTHTDLREFINTQSYHVRAQGGPRILIDGSDHWVFPPMDQGAAGLAFLLMLFGCVCSLSLFLNTTFYGGTIGRGDGSVITDHQLFFLGPDGQMRQRDGDNGRNNNHGNSSRRGNGLRLLTMEEVETLPTREYCSSSESSSPHGSSLELRDKTENEYVGNNNDDDDDDDGEEQQESSLHGSATTGAAAAALGREGPVGRQRHGRRRTGMQYTCTCRIHTVVHVVDPWVVSAMGDAAQAFSIHAHAVYIQ